MHKVTLSANWRTALAHGPLAPVRQPMDPLPKVEGYGSGGLGLLMPGGSLAALVNDPQAFQRQ